ncbi:MAG: UDP-N-acetylmuramoyl-L-alanine--D-glutamate ligase [Gemmatimonadetes bacterium]|nr:UDP-N-acetylmuramoyl-L-alanine--D-glutamate ligase [Gemmatimonadota bacterium]
MIRELLTRGEVAVVGLGRSGRAAARLLHRAGARVYASDGSATDAVVREAAALRALGIDAEAGGHDLERIGRAAVVVTSPGVPPEARPLACARARGVPVLSEVEVGLSFLPGARCIAITGTNGKTTVTALVHHLLVALGKRSVAAGNIGTSLCEIALAEPQPEWVALEMSSFQLHDTTSLAPAVGVLTNLAPDHLDRYASLDEYYGDKMRLFRNATPASRWVLNADDAEVMARTARVAGTRYRFSLRDVGADAGPATAPSTAEDAADAEDGSMPGGARGAGREVGAPGSDPRRWSLLGHDLLDRADIPLLGDHNVANVLAAALAVAVADPSHATPDALARLVQGVRTFHGMPHRLEGGGAARWPPQGGAVHGAPRRVAAPRAAGDRLWRGGAAHRTGPARPRAARAARIVIRGRDGARARGREAGRRGAAVPCLLELRHVQEL